MTGSNVDSRHAASQLGHTASATLIRRYGTLLQPPNGDDGPNAVPPKADETARTTDHDDDADQEAGK